MKKIKAHKLTPHVSYTVSKLTNAELKHKSRLITHCPGCELDSDVRITISENYLALNISTLLLFRFSTMSGEISHLIS